nr:8609_t:CDS:2 [Entrophospora candida]
MGVRLPMYIAINNALSAVSYSANVIGTLVIGIPWAGKACKIYGFFDTFVISMRIYLITIITALITSCIGLPSYGPSKYWCWTSPGEWSLAILLSLLISFTAILCLFCYSRIIYMIFTIKRPDSSVNGGRRGINNEQQKTATCKILIYTFNYLIQWTPTLPFILGVANSDDPIWVYYLYVLSTNIGSVSNAIQYIFNEKYYIIAVGDSSDRGCDIADVGGDDEMNSANSGNNVNSGNNNIENGKSVVDESVGGREGGSNNGNQQINDQQQPKNKKNKKKWNKPFIIRKLISIFTKDPIKKIKSSNNINTNNTNHSNNNLHNNDCDDIIELRSMCTITTTTNNNNSSSSVKRSISNSSSIQIEILELEKAVNTL